MKTMVLYSSKTGNTKQIAEAIHRALPEGATIHSVGDACAPDDADLVFFGFWVDKGMLDAKAREAASRLVDKKVAVFATLGAEPESEHAAQMITSARELLTGQRCEVLGTFVCQGRIDPMVIEMMKKMGQSPDNPHRMTPEREARHREAAKHPDAGDLENAALFAQSVLDSLP